MDVALINDLWVLGLGVGLGIQLFRLLICLLLIDLVLVVIIRPWCFLEKTGSSRFRVCLKDFYAVCQIFRLLTKS